MKKVKIVLFVIVTTLLNNSISISQIRWDFSYEDKIKVKIYPKKLTNVLENSIATIHIHNNSSDTLVTINSISLDGFYSWITIYPSLSRYLPNSLLLYSDDFPVTEGQGVFLVGYNELPTFIVIEPNTEKTLNINFNDFSQYLVGKTWEFKSFVTFAKKSVLDEIVKTNYSYEEYLCNLDYSDTNTLKIYNPDSEIIEEGRFDLIKEAFSILIMN